MRVENEIYNRLFQRDKDGQNVLAELCRLFYDRPSYVKGDTHETAHREGQRSVVAFLMHKCAVLEVEDGNEIH